MKKYLTVQDYFNDFPPDTKAKLTSIHDAIQTLVPKAQACISYNMPSFKLGKVLLYFAAYSKHIGFYPMPDTIIQFKEELNMYKCSKGAIQFPLHENLPLDLIRKMVLYRLEVLGMEEV